MEDAFLFNYGCHHNLHLIVIKVVEAAEDWGRPSPSFPLPLGKEPWRSRRRKAFFKKVCCQKLPTSSYSTTLQPTLNSSCLLPYYWKYWKDLIRFSQEKYTYFLSLHWSIRLVATAMMAYYYAKYMGKLFSVWWNTALLGNEENRSGFCSMDKEFKLLFFFLL